jgi:YfiH family protein
MAIGFRIADWSAPPGVRAGVTTRAGGASTGAHASFNLAAHVGDDPAAVAENRRRLRDALELPSEPLWLRQVHGVAVAVHDGAAPPDPEADAAVTFEPGRVLAVLTADCLPVVLASRDGTRLGVAHAGWRGTLADIAGATVRAMSESYGSRPADLLAAIGPAVGPCCYQVGPDVQQAFTARHEGAREWLHADGDGRASLDLVAANRALLEAAGVRAVESADLCTACNVHDFYSARAENRVNGCFGAAIVMGG